MVPEVLQSSIVNFTDMGMEFLNLALSSEGKTSEIELCIE